MKSLLLSVALAQTGDASMGSSTTQDIGALQNRSIVWQIALQTPASQDTQPHSFDVDILVEEPVDGPLTEHRGCLKSADIAPRLFTQTTCLALPTINSSSISSPPDATQTCSVSSRVAVTYRARHVDRTWIDELPSDPLGAELLSHWKGQLSRLEAWQSQTSSQTPTLTRCDLVEEVKAQLTATCEDSARSFERKMGAEDLSFWLRTMPPHCVMPNYLNLSGATRVKTHR